jgi:hypothetical protein
MHYKERRMLLERTFAIAKLTAISMVIVVAILCLGYSNAYGLTAPLTPLTKPGEQSQVSQNSAGMTTGNQFDFNVETGSGSDDIEVTLGTNESCPPVPEPMTLILLGAGLAGIKLLRRRD